MNRVQLESHRFQRNLGLTGVTAVDGLRVSASCRGYQASHRFHFRTPPSGDAHSQEWADQCFSSSGSGQAWIQDFAVSVYPANGCAGLVSPCRNPPECDTGFLSAECRWFGGKQKKSAKDTIETLVDRAGWGWLSTQELTEWMLDPGN